MYAQVEKSKANKSRSVANFVALKTSNVAQNFGFVDNRPEAVAQRKLHEVANNSYRMLQLKVTQEKPLQQMIIQRINTIDQGGVQWNNLGNGDIYWWDKFEENHIAADLPTARAKALIRASNDHYAGRYTFMSSADLKDAIRALGGTFGQDSHDVQLQNVNYLWVTILYGADNNRVKESDNANGNVNISFRVTNEGYIRVHHMQYT